MLEDALLSAEDVKALKEAEKARKEGKLIPLDEVKKRLKLK